MIQTSFVTGATVHDDPQVYDFSDPLDLRKIVAGDPLFVEIVQTGAFRRLNEVRFLGGIDYLLIPNPNGARGNIRYTRFQHSLGVARLALMYARATELSETDRRLLVVAALFHDIGHAPLSHSLEPVFKELFGMDHHQATRDILRGHVAIGRDVYKLLHRYRVDVDRIAALISGADHGFFSGPINFDTIEGILRTKAYAQSMPNVSAPELIVDAAVNRSSPAHQEMVDQFWKSKDQVYRHVINSPRGVLADEACKAFMRRFIKDVQPEDYFTTEDLLFRKLPGLRLLLTSENFSSDVVAYVPEFIPFTKRRFLINQTASFFEQDDINRYAQTRERDILKPLQ